MTILDTRQTELQQAHDNASQQLAAIERQIKALTEKRDELVNAIRRIRESSQELGVIRQRVTSAPDSSESATHKEP